MKKTILLFLLLSSFIFSMTYQYNGETLTLDDVQIEKAFQVGVSNFEQQYGDSLSVDELKNLIFNNVIEQELLLKKAVSLKITVPEKEIDEQFAQIQSKFPDTVTFDNVLQAQGFTKETLKKELKEKLQLDKVKEKIESEAIVTEEELKAYYEENKFNSFFVGKPFVDVKTDINDFLLEEKKGQVFRNWLEKAVKNYKVKENDKYFIYSPKVIYEKECFLFTNVDLDNRKIMLRVEGIADEAVLEKMAKESIDKELQVVAKAKALGLKIGENLSQSDKISAYIEEYQKYLIATLKISEAELQEYFTANAPKYDVQGTYNAQVIELPMNIGIKDEAIAREKAESILKKALVKGADFASLAKKYSEDGSAPQGGELGWFKKDQMVEPFADAAFAGEKGKIFPKVIKSEFGYHIIKVEDKKTDGSEVKASHILITIKVGADTLKDTHEKALALVENLNSGKTTFEAAAKEWSLSPDSFNFTGITKGEAIPDFDQDENLSKALEKAAVNEVSFSIAERAFVYKKTKETLFKSADFASVKDRVFYDIAREKVGEQLQALLK